MARRPDARWRETDSIFATALEREPAQREAFVALACGGDADLAVRIHALLRSSDRAESFLETPIFSLSDGLRVSDPGGVGAGTATGRERPSGEVADPDRPPSDPLGLSGRQISHFGVREVLD